MWHLVVEKQGFYLLQDYLTVILNPFKKIFVLNQYNILKSKYAITRRGSAIEEIKFIKNGLVNRISIKIYFSDNKMKWNYTK